MEMSKSESVREDGTIALQTDYGMCIGLFLFYAIINGVPNFLFDYFGSIYFPLFETPLRILYLFLVTLPLTYGIRFCFLKVFRNQPAEFSDLFAGFNNYKRTIIAVFLTGLYIFLWLLLLIVPGVIKYFSCKFVPYILFDNPDISIKDALALSKKLSNGFKLTIFLWNILYVLACGGVGVLAGIVCFAFYDQIGNIAGTLAWIFWFGPKIFLLDAGCYQMAIETPES